MRNILLAGLLLAALPAVGADIRVEVRNAPNGDGQVVVALFASEATFLERAELEGRAAPGPDGRAIVDFSGVMPGEYAISVFHDQNGNGKLDTNFMGVPKEPFAFSNNARRKFGAPKYEDARFELGDADLPLIIDFP